MVIQHSYIAGTDAPCFFFLSICVGFLFIRVCRIIRLFPHPLSHFPHGLDEFHGRLRSFLPLLSGDNREFQAETGEREEWGQLSRVGQDDPAQFLSFCLLDEAFPISPESRL